MSQQLFIECENTKIDLKVLNDRPEETLRQLITQQSNNHITPNLLHSVIKIVMSKDDNHLKRLLYYFFETMDTTTKDFVICINQVKKDLMSPNEFVRSFALQFVAKLQNPEYAAMFLKDIKDNIAGKCTTVKINALYCLGEFGKRFDFEVENYILDAMKKESSSHVLCVGFDAMDKLGMSFEDFLDSEYPKEVLELLVHKVDDLSFLKKMIVSKHDSVSFYSSCKLLKLSPNNSIYMENILRILESNSDYKTDFIPYLKFVNSNAYDLLVLIDPYNLDFASSAIDAVFRIADTIDFMKISEFLYQKYIETVLSSDKKRSFKILVLNKMTKFSATHCIYVHDLVSNSMENVLSDDPELIFASLEFLSTCLTKQNVRDQIHSFLIENFSKIKFGKITRKIFDILSDRISKSQFESLLDKLISDLKIDISEAPVYLTKEPEVFAGAYICMSIAQMYDPSWNLKAKTVGTILKILEVGNSRNIVDISSKSTINTSIRSILAENSKQLFEEKNLFGFCSVPVLKPVEFNILKPSSNPKKFIWNDLAGNNQSTVQLSGLGDPLYVEADCIYSKYEISLDLLIINQTTSYLQDMSIDFNFSQNIQMVTSVEPFSLQPSSAITLKAQFSIIETLASFVTGTITFKYPGKNDYSGRPFVLNLAELKLDVNQFLEGADIDFKSLWPTLEWENIYSLTIRKNCNDLLQKIGKVLNANICNKLESSGFTAGNFACYTLQRTLILVNVCINSNQNSLVELRVRSKNEDLVKAVSSLLTNYLKSMQ